MMPKFLTPPVVVIQSIFAAVLLMPEVALAQNNAEWVNAETSLIEVLRSNMDQIGAIIIGFFIIGAGICIIISGEPNLLRLARHHGPVRTLSAISMFAALICIPILAFIILK